MKTIEEALTAYNSHFGENYPLVVTDSRTSGEVISDIKNCIKTNTKAEKPKYEVETEY